MTKTMKKWGIAVIAIFMLVIGVIGNLIFDPSLPFILGLFTGAVLIVLINVIYMHFFKEADPDEDELK